MSNGVGVGPAIMIGLVLTMTLGISIYLIQASIVGLEEVIWFFPLTCLLPLLVMTIVSWICKIYRLLTRTETRS